MATDTVTVRPSPPRISRPLIAVGVFTVIFCLSAIIGINIRHVNRGLQDRLTRALRLAEYTLPPAIWQFNYDYLNNFVRALFLDERVVHARILADGVALVQRRRAPFEGATFDDLSRSSLVVTGVTEIVYNGKAIGTVEVALSREGIYGRLILNAAGAGLVMSAILGAIVLYYARLRESERRYRTLFNNAIEGIFQTSPSGRIIGANPSMARILGDSGPEALSAAVTDFRRQLFVHRRDCRPMRRRLREGGRVNGQEARLRRRDGEMIWVAISAQAIRDNAGRLLYYDGLLTEITEAKEKAEAERAREAAEASARAKSEFLANMSHEIRTPMNAVMGLTDLALKTDLTGRQRDYLNKIWSSARVLLGIINDVLDFSKIEAGKLDLSADPFDLLDVLENLSDMFGSRAAEKSLDLVITADPEVPRRLVGDPLRLSQVLINLTGNAVKFTESGEIVVQVTAAGGTDERVRLRFTVRDTGIGIEPERLSALFDPFTQADDSITRRYGGTGLGLTISRRLVELMGGRISAESLPTGGSIFSFTADFALPADSARSTGILGTPPPAIEGMRVILMDRHATSRDAMARMLNSFSFSVTPVEDETALTATLETTSPPADLVILDWRVPGLEDILAARHIRARRETRHLPILMVTTFRREDEIHGAQDAGVDAFVYKPVKQSALFNAILELFGEAGGIEAAGIEAAGALDFSGVRVLVVEDNPINQQVAQELLASAGIEVVVAEDGARAIATLRSDGNFDALFMDIQMPVMDGLEATRRIRAAEAGGHPIPIIAMTAHAMRGDGDRCMAAGMTDYITKPIDTAALFGALSRCLAPVQAEPPAGPPRDRSRTETPAEVSPPEPYPGIDVDAALDRLLGNRRLLEKLVGQLRRDFSDSADQIATALTEGDLAEAVRLAHTVKGVAGNLSATRLQAAAERLEAGLRDDDKARIEADLDRFRTALDEVSRDDGPPQPAERTAAEPAGTGSSAGPAGLAELTALVNGNSPRAGTCLAGLRAWLASHGVPDQAAELANQIDHFDFRAARKTLAEITRRLRP